MSRPIFLCLFHYEFAEKLHRLWRIFFHDFANSQNSIIFFFSNGYQIFYKNFFLRKKSKMSIFFYLELKTPKYFGKKET